MLVLENCSPSKSTVSTTTTTIESSRCSSLLSSSTLSSSSPTTDNSSMYDHHNKASTTTTPTSMEQSTTWLDRLRQELGPQSLARLERLIETHKLTEHDLCQDNRVQQSLAELFGHRRAEKVAVVNDFFDYLEQQFRRDAVPKGMPKTAVELMKAAWRANSLNETSKAWYGSDNNICEQSKTIARNGFRMCHHESFDDCTGTKRTAENNSARLLELIDQWKVEQGHRHDDDDDGNKDEDNHDGAETIERGGANNNNNNNNKTKTAPGTSKLPQSQIINFMTTNAVAHFPGPNEDELAAILVKSGYPLELSNGQRKYGPPIDFKETLPNGCEIFVGRIPKEVFEDELIKLFETIGTIYDLRLMIDPSTGCSRGYAFITFFTPEHADQAVAEFDNYEIRKSKTIRVNISVPNMRLFIGNIPKEMTKDEIFAEFKALTTGLKEVIVYKLPADRKRNRGFCFLEFDTHKHASMARRRLLAYRPKIWGAEILVDWAEPLEEPDEETMAKVKVLYVRNIGNIMNDEQIRQFFGSVGTVERVKRIRDYAFVHFETRELALQAMERFNDTEIGNGVHLEISLAKPPSDRKRREDILRNRERRLVASLQVHGHKPMLVYASPDFGTSGANAFLAQPGGAQVGQSLLGGSALPAPVGAGTAAGHGLLTPVAGHGMLTSVGSHQLVSSTTANLLSAGTAQLPPPAGYPQLCAAAGLAPTVVNPHYQQQQQQPHYHQPQHHHQQQHHHHHQQQQPQQYLHPYPVPQQYALPALPTGSPVLRVTVGADTTVRHTGHSSLVHTPPSAQDVNNSMSPAASSTPATLVSGHMAFQVTPTVEAVGQATPPSANVHYNYMDPNWYWYLQQSQAMLGLGNYHHHHQYHHQEQQLVATGHEAADKEGYQHTAECMFTTNNTSSASSSSTSSTKTSTSKANKALLVGETTTNAKKKGEKTNKRTTCHGDNAHGNIH